MKTKLTHCTASLIAAVNFFSTDSQLPRCRRSRRRRHHRCRRRRRRRLSTSSSFFLTNNEVILIRSGELGSCLQAPFEPSHAIVTWNHRLIDPSTHRPIDTSTHRLIN